MKKAVLKGAAFVFLGVCFCSFDVEFDFEKVNNLSVPDAKAVTDEGLSSSGEEEFDPALPKTPPPDSINIPRNLEGFIKKGVGVDFDDFDITDRSQIKYLEIVSKNSSEQGFDAELVLAIIKKESNFNPRVKSDVGAVGLMQVLPDTARWLGLKNTAKLTDPDINIKYGIKYLRYLFSQFAENINYSVISRDDIYKEEILKVIAAYNAGPANVKKYDKPPYNGIPPFKETRIYIKKVLFYFVKFKDLKISTSLSR
ncbi:MAG: lytic transglycosylase domain-containing protein [Elusimicrobiales bacterium]